MRGVPSNRKHMRGVAKLKKRQRSRNTRTKKVKQTKAARKRGKR